MFIICAGWTTSSCRHSVMTTCSLSVQLTRISANDDPVEVVTRLSRNLMGDPLLVHSTSWRRARGSVILSFVVVNRDDQAPELTGIPIVRAQLARGGATSAPSSIGYAQVLEHGLRHLAWLVADDEVVRTTLSDDWKKLLSEYVPEPFRHLQA